MQYNNTTTQQGIVQDIKFLLTGKYNGSIDYEDEDILRNVNARLDQVVSEIMRADGRWEFDDNNFDTLPIGTTTLVDGQQDYEISVGDFLNVHELSVKDINGNYQELKPVDRNKGTAQELLDLEKTSNNGLPRFYDKMGNTILLYPKPSASKVTLSEGLKVVFQRQPSYFVSGDTTKSPGFASPYHRLLSVGAAIDWTFPNEAERKRVTLQAEWDKLMAGLIDYYADRSKDEQPRIRLEHEDYGGSALSGMVISEDKFNV